MPDAIPDPDLAAELRREIAGQADAVDATLRDRSLGRYLDAVAEAVAASGELLVTGMGASLYAGLVLAALLRGRGRRAWALPASELLHYGEAVAMQPTLVLSQSGASVEVERLLARRPGSVFGLTLDPDSALGRAGAGIVPGGPERAYAATRSFTTTLAALLGLAQRLGVPVRLRRLAGSLEGGPGGAVRLDEAVEALSAATTLFVTGRGPFHALAEYVALLLMELTRVPSAALESAQFRHGPYEAAGGSLGVVALAAEGGTGPLVRRFAGALAAAGSPTVLLDAGLPVAGDTRLAVGGSGTRPVVRVPLSRSDELGALLPLAAAAQRLSVGLAEARGVTPGVPLRSGKVTREE